MATNQENIIATIETKLGLSGLNYNEAIMELCRDAGVADSNFNAMFAEYLSIATGVTESNINGLLSAYANEFFDGNVNDINDLSQVVP